MKKSIYILLIIHCSLSIAQWQPDVRLTDAPNNSYTSYNNSRSIAADGNNIHIIWYDNRGGTYNQIYYKRSTDGGINWGADTQLTNNTWYLTGYPSINVSGMNVHLSWIYNHNAYGMLFYKLSTDGGVSWTQNSQLTSTNISAYYPSITASGQFVHISYSYWQPSKIYYSRSQNGGIGWNTPLTLTSIPSVSYFPSIAASDNLVHIVWQDVRENSEMYYIRSSDFGSSWGAETRLTNNGGYSMYPSAAASGVLVHVVWQDNRDENYEIYYKRSVDGGLNWQEETRLTNNPDSSYYPSIYASGSNLHITWQDFRNGNWEVYYKKSTDGGLSWDADTRLTNNNGISQNPSLAVSNSKVYAVWNDNRDGNFEVYFKRNPTGNPLGINIINSEIPNDFSLSQNYPNPFNPTTVISFQLPVNSFTSLIIYDNLGRQVATLVNEQLQPGTYEVNWDGSNYSSGIYYYRIAIQSDKLTAIDPSTSLRVSETKKMILIK